MKLDMLSTSPKVSVLIGASVIIAALFVAYALMQSHRPVTTETEVSFLYVQTASAGSLLKSEDAWMLTLEGVAPETIYFSDRPARETGQGSTGDFVAEWSAGEHSFAAVPPNAALEFVDSTGETQVIVLELMNPDYNPDTAVLTYEAIILDGDPEEGTTYGSLSDPALFIDSTYKHYTCDCHRDGEVECTCAYQYTLGHGKTKEFRTTCKNSKHTDVIVTKKKKTTTCTVHFMTESFGGNYTSKSCTNWHASKHDTVTVKAICTQDEPRSADYDRDDPGAAS